MAAGNERYHRFERSRREPGVQICPKNIPLITSISIVYGQAMKQAHNFVTDTRKDHGREVGRRRLVKR
jgi:hypothetical protein